MFVIAYPSPDKIDFEVTKWMKILSCLSETTPHTDYFVAPVIIIGDVKNSGVPPAICGSLYLYACVPLTK